VWQDVYGKRATHDVCRLLSVVFIHLQVDLLHRRKPQLLVATPGRLLDLVDSGVLDFNLTDCVVLDEADKMLSVGFEPQLQRLQALLLGSKAGKAAGDVADSGSKKKGKAAKKQQQAAGGAAGQQCQVLLFSATLPKAVRVTADAWLKPGYESVSCSAGADSISRTITQVSLTHMLAALFEIPCHS
jgi:superfamily II DNA/RNA helicase